MKFAKGSYIVNGLSRKIKKDSLMEILNVIDYFMAKRVVTKDGGVLLWVRK
jgi:hypothetical protein